jgi:hypothetical protein
MTRAAVVPLPDLTLHLRNARIVLRRPDAEDAEIIDACDALMRFGDPQEYATAHELRRAAVARIKARVQAEWRATHGAPPPPPRPWFNWRDVVGVILLAVVLVVFRAVTP